MRTIRSIKESDVGTARKADAELRLGEFDQVQGAKVMNTLFWWLADALNQPKTRGCLSDFMLIVALTLLALLVYALIRGS